MKLWDSLAICLTLLCCVHARPPRTRAEEPPPGLPSVSSPGTRSDRSDSGGWEEPLVEGSMEQRLSAEAADVLDFIKVTLRRSTMSSFTSTSNSTGRTRLRRERRKKGSDATGLQEGKWRRAGGGRGQGCGLKHLHLNVSDLGLGYRSDEEMIFKYCSGHCRKSETNYDKILHSLTQEKRFPPRDAPPQACCRPVAFDDDLSFMDDNFVFHTLRKHSARKCACV